MRVLRTAGFAAYVLTYSFYVAARSQEGPSMSLRAVLASAALYAVQDRAQELIDAVLAGDVEEVRALLEAGVDANTRNDEGVWALILAAGSGHREVAAVLIEAGAWVNLTMPNGSAALAASAKGGHTEITRDLLKASAEVDAQNRMGVTALMVAARNGNPETIEALLDGGADVNVETEYGGNAIRIAVIENHVPATMLLLRAGADTENIKGQETLPDERYSRTARRGRNATRIRRKRDRVRVGRRVPRRLSRGFRKSREIWHQGGERIT